jgi:hypothetical protein
MGIEVAGSLFSVELPLAGNSALHHHPIGPAILAGW